MTVIGRALARLALRTGGQVLLEVPDDLSPDFVGRILEGANLEVRADPAFAIFAHDQRADVESIKPSVDFRELAMYRFGSRLAVAYASDNRGMATYTSVYPLLLAAGFPADALATRGTGMADLHGFLRHLAAIVEEGAGAAGGPGGEFQEAFMNVARFLARAYEQAAGTGASSVASDWWVHVDHWASFLVQRRVRQVAQVYGGAGLPIPVEGTSLQMSASDYLRVLKSRWSDASGIRAELARLEEIPSARAAALDLAGIDWGARQGEVGLRTDSPVARVAFAGSLDQPLGPSGWSQLTESDFQQTYADAAGKLELKWGGKDLPRPWATAVPLLMPDKLRAASEDTTEVEGVELIVPWRRGIRIPDQLPDAKNLVGQVEVGGIRGSQASFQLSSAFASQTGLCIQGTLTLSPSRKATHTYWLEARARAPVAQWVVDRCDGVFGLVHPEDVCVQVRSAGKSSASALRGPVIWRSGVGETQIKLGSPGTYEVAVACGIASGVSASHVDAGGKKLDGSWLIGDEGQVLGSIDAGSDFAITAGATAAPMFRLEVVEASSQLPLSPVIASAEGLQPDSTRPIPETVLSVLERHLCGQLASEESGALGMLLLTDSRQIRPLVQSEAGVWCCEGLQNRISELSPCLPSAALLAHPAYRAMRDAYQALKIPEQLEAIELEKGASGVTVSRISLEYLQKDQIDQLLTSYVTLIGAANSMGASDRFWARHPYCVAVFPDQMGAQSISAVLLSPLHPIRLGWMWAVQVGLRAAYDDDANPVASLGLVDGTLFPVTCAVENEDFGTTAGFVPVPVDGQPSDVFMGWQAMVQLDGQRPNVPEWLNGDRFPVDGVSALSTSSVVAAVDDFLRVWPHVQALQVELATTLPARRSQRMDEGMLAKIKALALDSSGLDGVAGIRIVDSTNRLGPIPRMSAIQDALALARPNFNAEWVSSAADAMSGAHITFLESSAASLALTEHLAPAMGWLPLLPLRRFPHRYRATRKVGIEDYGLKDLGGEADPLWRGIRAYETGPSGQRHVVRIRPNLSALPNKPKWLVASDFGINPGAIAEAARDQSDGHYMLWDWRPAAMVTHSEGPTARANPYFVLASVPSALSNAIRLRLEKLHGPRTPSVVEARAKQLVETLAARAVGLNALLAVGHNQATGALGFYFALSSLVLWMNAGEDEEIRLIVPIDAVDSFLRTGLTSAKLDSRRRADLLAVHARVTSAGPVRIVLVPIEIKHYGLNHAGEATYFPSSDDPGLGPHVDQLYRYQSHLEEVCEDYRTATGGRASIVGQRLALVLDAAVQLSPREVSSAPTLLGAVCRGEASIELGKGLLLWYQAGGRTEGGDSAAWEEVFGPLTQRRVDVRVDPASFEGCFWANEAGRAHKVVAEAMACAVGPGEADGLADATAVPSDPPGPTYTDGQAPSQVPPNAERARDRAASPKTDTGVRAGEEVAARTKLSGEELERRYRRVLAALGEFHVKVERPSGQSPYEEGPAFIEYAVTPAYGVSVSRIESQLENLKLRLKLPADAVIGCSTHLGNVLLTVPKAESERYYVDATDLWRRWKQPDTGFAIPIGEDISGIIVELDLASPNSPHLLVAGVTGSGKSEALLTILHGATRFYSPDQLRLRLVDPKQTELNSLAACPHTVGPISWSAEEAIAILDEAVNEMEARYSRFRLAGPAVRNINDYQTQVGPLARWVIVLDEYADLIADKDDRKKIEKNLQRLSQKARAAGIHLIVSTQKPVVEVVNTVVKGNLPGRIALRVNTSTESRVVLDETGAEQLVGKGDAFLKIGSARIRLQFARHQP